MPNRFTTGLFVQPAMGVHPCSHTCSGAVEDCSEQGVCMEGGHPLVWLYDQPATGGYFTRLITLALLINYKFIVAISYEY